MPAAILQPGIRSGSASHAARRRACSALTPPGARCGSSSTAAAIGCCGPPWPCGSRRSARGSLWLMAYDNTPGAAADAPRLAGRQRAGARCRRADAGDARASALRLHARQPWRTRGAAGAHVTFPPADVRRVHQAWRRAAAGSSPARGDQATRIPGVTVVRDDDGAEAAAIRRLRPRGRRCCTTATAACCIPAARPARAARPATTPDARTLLALLARRPPGRARHTPVFGCPLFVRGCGSSAKAQGDAMA